MASFTSQQADLPKVGSRITLESNGTQATINGTVRFTGQTKFKSGDWIGVELDTDKGKHDGTVDGAQYFKCKPGHGIFVRPSSIKAISIEEVQRKAANLSMHEMVDIQEERKASDGIDDFLFEIPARAFRFDKSVKQWTEIGMGAAKFSWHGSSNKIRLNLSEQNILVLDHLVDPATKLEENILTQQSWVFRAIRYSVASIKEVLCLQFGTVNLARNFVTSFERSRALLPNDINTTSRKKNRGQLHEPDQKTRLMRRRLTVSGSDRNLDGLDQDKDIKTESSRISEPSKSIKNGQVGTWKHENTRIEIAAYSGVSRKGLAPYNPEKQNQDAMIMVQLPRNGNCNGELLLACFDGHGSEGHFVSRRMQLRIPQILEESKDFANDELTCKVLADALLEVEQELVNDRTVDTSLSGTTAVVSLLRGDKLFVANVGDSRIIKGCVTKADPNTVLAQDLSNDHKPDDEVERQRIVQSGGRVFAMKYDDGIDGPARVWLSYADMPGLAMSRSLCDTVGKEAGVISNAELHCHTLISSVDKFIVVATDGLWEFMTSQEVATIVARHMSSKDPRAAIAELIRESNSRWQQEEPVIDDTTIVIAYLA